MGSCHPTRHICHSSSLPRATVGRREVGAWRLVLSPRTASPNLRPPGSSWRPSSAVELVTRSRWREPPLHTFLLYPLCGRSVVRVVRKTRQIFVTLPVNGKSSAGELMRRDPPLLVTSAILGGAEAHSHIAPSKLAP
jgi:hypothetical protein